MTEIKRKSGSVCVCMRAVSVSHTTVERARSGDDKMRCEFLLILYPICWLHLSLLARPKVLRRLRNEYRGNRENKRGEKRVPVARARALWRKRERAEREEGKGGTKALG